MASERVCECGYGESMHRMKEAEEPFPGAIIGPCDDFEAVDEVGVTDGD